ncbi:MAG TPA: haloalkane dehalogenase [Kribbellaceae bacterium]|jgi:haloalkane dehalogenase
MTIAGADVALPRVEVLDSTMAYRTAGEDGPVALFLHGNPTSSYIWRNVMPHVGEVARCVAPDLIGFGQSGKPGIGYGFLDHADYLDAFIERLGITSAYLVAQDWGTALAFHLAARRPGLVRGLAFMEFIRPMPSWAEFAHNDETRDLFRRFRTPGAGEELIIGANLFVEAVLPRSVIRELTEEEMSVYRAPFLDPDSRLPVWRLPNELPIAGEPAAVHDALTRAHDALASSTYPKLLFVGDPGVLVSPAFGECFAAGLRDCELVRLGRGAHYLQEDHPEAIGVGIRRWIDRVEGR